MGVGSFGALALVSLALSVAVCDLLALDQMRTD